MKKGDDGRYLSEKARAVKCSLDTLYSNECLFDLSAEHYVLDARAAWMADIKQLIEHFIRLKQIILESLPKCTMFLNRTLFNIQNWRKSINLASNLPSSLSSTNLTGGSSSSALNMAMSQTSLHMNHTSHHGTTTASTPSTPNLNVQMFKYGSQINVNEYKKR